MEENIEHERTLDGVAIARCRERLDIEGLRLSSNPSLDDLAKHQGDDRLASRIAGRADVIRMDVKDQRMPVATKVVQHGR